MVSKKQDISIVITGEAGQGIQTVERLLVTLLHHAGYYVFSTKEYMSRVRGGSNSTEIRVSTLPVAAYVDRIDILVVLDNKAFDHISYRMTDDTIIIGDKTQVKTISHPHVFSFDFLNAAKEIGNKVFANTIAVGLLASLFHISKDLIHDHITSFFKEKSKQIISGNKSAIEKGIAFAQTLSESSSISEKINKKHKKKNDDSSALLLNGTQAIGLGALAGGCNFISSYPMSPSTGVLTFLSSVGDKANVFVEQAEDEIAAVNMALGAWFAGGRALVSTSGGGFALMAEGLSLAAMTETPLVIHLAQRPGPATGLPTRTEQGDLHLALYSGHGEFPRVIFAPGSLQDGFMTTKKAFDIADAFQIPAIILSDQYFVDSKYQTSAFKDLDKKPNHHIVKTSTDYLRYDDNESGVSPRGIPGYGSGFIHVDSDEHDTDGRITECAEVRKQMVEKRLRKIHALRQQSIEPTLFGSSEYNILLIGWGSTLQVIEESRNLIADNRVSFLHFSQVFPLHPKTKSYLENAKTIITIENNATAQFSDLLEKETGVSVDAHILQYTGHPFSVETLVDRIPETIEAAEGN
ncbi:MAG: 2-oxoacid:acceptor oxidoreductase subunit alpha [Candidatus Krumholzibacteriota bacterium]|nr:2-oxoacid:acceptor oxidoreductase subunit alpha [Candidatus Krumholzibacteriota bacterium]